MNSKTVAVIDLGSNTFHLKIIDSVTKATIYRERIFVSLAEKGIDLISPSAFARGLEAMLHFKSLLVEYRVGALRAVGTAALRSAANAGEFVSAVVAATEIKIEVIEGPVEAAYIYRGIASLIDMDRGQHVIMDIGGGSVEFIYVLGGRMRWVKSYNIGLGVLYNSLPHSHPITTIEKAGIETHIQATIADLRPLLSTASIDCLVGASGSFEVLAVLLGHEVSPDTCTRIDTEQAHAQIRALYTQTITEINADDRIPSSRARLIILAMVLIEVVLDMTKAPTICLSPAAMKEGILEEMLEATNQPPT